MHQKKIWKMVMGVAATALAAGAIGIAVAGESRPNGVAILHPTEGNTAKGIVMLERTPDGVRLTAAFEGLSAGKHGFHVHEFGDCSSPDGKSAGGHYNPRGTAHGGPADRERHMGDLGNILVDKDGRSNVVILDPHLALEGPDSVVGRALVLHGGEDDLHSQPAGDAGPRVACGVIGIARP